MTNEVKQDVEKRMQKAIESLNHELSRIRTGRAHASFLDHVQVDYHGSMVPLKQIANVSTSDSRTLQVTPWEKSMVAAIEKAIRDSELGLNPSSAGTTIRVPMPALTEERRKELIKVVRSEAEQSRVIVRNIRRDANTALKALVKDKSISEDEERRGSEQMQKLTDKFIVQIDKILAEKEKDLMEV